MSTVRIDVKSTYNDVEVVNTFHYWDQDAFGNPTTIGGLLTDFVGDVIPLWQAWLPDNWTFNEIVGRALDYPFPVVQALAVTGDVVAVEAALKPVYNPLLVKLTVSENRDPVTGSLYVGAFPVRSGRKYFSGFNEGFEGLSGYLNPGGTAGDNVNLFFGALNDNREAGGNVWVPVILGYPIMDGSTMLRDYLVAPITGAVPRYFTKLKSRME